MKNTKKSLLVSVLSLVLCFAMLLGTTYAWFTDSVQSGKNTITAGNLDVELKHTNANVTDAVVKDSTDLFLAKDGTAIKWEPGVIAYENFTVSNEGDLALKYAFTLNVHNCNTFNEKALTDVIKVAVVDGGFKGTTRADIPAGTEFGDLTGFLKNGNLAVSGDNSKNTYGVVLYWEPTDHDNDYNVNNGQKTDDNGNALFIEFGVNLVATQDTVEADSFGTDYDKTAPLSVSFTPMTKKLAPTEKLKIKVPEEAQSSVKEATVPAAIANAVFDEVFEGSDATDKSLTLVLNVEEKSKTETTFNYEIDMDAVIKEITGGEVTKNETKNVNELGLTFTDFVEVQMTIASGLNDVTVKHNGNDMTEAESLEAAKAITPEDEDGYFNYTKATGLTKLWIKSFSPFTVSGTMPEARIIRNGEVVAEYLTVWDGLKAVTQDNDILQITSDVLNVPSTLYLNQCLAVRDPEATPYGFRMDGPAASKYTIDLNGHTLSGKTTSGIFQAGSGQEVEVTFMDSSEAKTGKVINTSFSYCAIYQNQNEGKIIIESGTYSGGKATLHIESDVEIKGGKFENSVKGYDAPTNAACIETKSYSNVIISGGIFAPEKHLIYGNNMGPKSITISGGDFTGITQNNIFVNVTDMAAAQYTISITGGKFDFNAAEAFPHYWKAN